MHDFVAAARHLLAPDYVPSAGDEEALFNYFKREADQKRLDREKNIEKGYRGDVRDRNELAAFWAHQAHDGQWRFFFDEPHTAHTGFVAEAYASFFPDDKEGIQTAHLHDLEEDAHKRITFLIKKLNQFSRENKKRKRLNRYIREEKEINLSLRQKPFSNWSKKHLGKSYLVREFLRDFYGITIDDKGRLEVLGSVRVPENLSGPAEILRHYLDDASDTNNPMENDKFTHFLIQKIGHIFDKGKFEEKPLITANGHGVRYGLYILSRLSNDEKFNFAFIDPRTDAVMRKRTATIKCLDVWHNLATLNFDTEKGLVHANKALGRMVRLMPYLKGSADPRAYNLALIALKKAHKRWEPIWQRQMHEKGDPDPDLLPPEKRNQPDPNYVAPTLDERMRFCARQKRAYIAAYLKMQKAGELKKDGKDITFPPHDFVPIGDSFTLHGGATLPQFRKGYTRPASVPSLR